MIFKRRVKLYDVELRRLDEFHGVVTKYVQMSGRDKREAAEKALDVTVGLWAVIGAKRIRVKYR